LSGGVVRGVEVMWWESLRVERFEVLSFRGGENFKEVLW
jgi:hypothetical protein